MLLLHCFLLLQVALPSHAAPVSSTLPHPPTHPPFHRSELLSRGLEATFVEEEVEAASVGKGSVAVGEVADNISADLVVLSTAGGWWSGGVLRGGGGYAW